MIKSKERDTITNTTESATATTVVEDTKEPVTVVGMIVNCDRLRLRKTPCVKDNVIGELDSGDVLVIDMDASIGEFYKVTTSTGISGFCMKKFVKIV